MIEQAFCVRRCDGWLNQALRSALMIWLSPNVATYADTCLCAHPYPYLRTGLYKCLCAHNPHVYMSTCLHVYMSTCLQISVHPLSRTHTPRLRTGTFHAPPLRVGMCVDPCKGVRVDVCVDMCVNTSVNMCVDMCAETHVQRHV